MQHTGDDTADVTVHALIGEFLAARATRKPSVHTLAAYRRDLTSIVTLVAEHTSPDEPDTLPLAALSPRALRAAFARFAADRAPASVYRAWSLTIGRAICCAGLDVTPRPGSV